VTLNANLISGGCCTKDSEGNLTLEKNQDPENALVQSIVGSQNSKLAVGLVIGKLKVVYFRKTATDSHKRKQEQDSQPRSSTSLQYHGLVPCYQCVV